MDMFMRLSRGRTAGRAAQAAAHDKARGHRQPLLSGWIRRVAAGAAFVIPVAMIAPVTAQAVAPPGNGFVVTAGDLSFILKQIKIAERHSATLTAVQPVRHPGAAPASDQIPDLPDLLRPAHRRRLLQQPLRRARDVRAPPTSLPAADHPEVP